LTVCLLQQLSTHTARTPKLGWAWGAWQREAHPTLLPVPEQLAPPPPTTPTPTTPTPAALTSIKLIALQPRNELHHLRDGAVVLYKRERSSSAVPGATASGN